MRISRPDTSTVAGRIEAAKHYRERVAGENEQRRTARERFTAAALAEPAQPIERIGGRRYYRRGGLLPLGGIAELPRCHVCGTQPEVKGMGVCRRHGGGRALVKRAREIIVDGRRGRALEWAVRTLARARRNEARAFRGGRPGAIAIGEEADDAWSRIPDDLRPIAGRLVAAAETLRPYRPEECRLAAADLVLLIKDPAWAFCQAASTLALEQDERPRALTAFGKVLGTAWARRVSREEPDR